MRSNLDLHSHFTQTIDCLSPANSPTHWSLQACCACMVKGSFIQVLQERVAQVIQDCAVEHESEWRSVQDASVHTELVDKEDIAPQYDRRGKGGPT
eukprot:1487804-Amphidinium_carterae.1